MSGGRTFHFMAADCPGCGEPDAARMGSTRWGHPYACCSDACGKSVATVLAQVRASQAYLDTQDAIARLTERAERMKQKALEEARKQRAGRN